MYTYFFLNIHRERGKQKQWFQISCLGVALAISHLFCTGDRGGGRFFNVFICVFFYTDAPYGELLLHSNLPSDKTIAGNWHCSTVAILIRLIVRNYVAPNLHFVANQTACRSIVLKEIHMFTVPKVNNSPKSDHFVTGWRMIQVIGVHSGHRTWVFPPYSPLLSSMGSPANNGYFRGAKKLILNQKQV